MLEFSGMHFLFVAGVCSTFQIQVTIAVAQETVIVCQSMFVYPAPFVSKIGRNKQQQGTLRLMKIGNQTIDYPEFISRSNYDLGGSRQVVDLILVE